MGNPRKVPTVQLSDDVIAVHGQSNIVPLHSGEQASGRSVTIKSDSYPSSVIEDLNWIEVIDAAQSGLGATFEYDKQRKSLYIILGDNSQVGSIKRKRRLTKHGILTHWKWAKRVIFGSWDRDLETWIEEDEEREARQLLAASPGQFAGDQQEEDHALGVEVVAGRKLDYLDLWRTRIHKYSRILEFVCLGVPVVIASLDVALYVGMPVSAFLFLSAWLLDGVKSKNRRWKARLGSE